MGVLHPADDGRRGTVGDAAAVEDPSSPATRGDLEIVSIGTSLRNWARGLRAPLWWFFQAMRVMTSFITSVSTPYFSQ